MSQSLEFRITASDQASRVVTQVQKKIQDFGKDIGTSIMAVAGPMAVLTMAIGKVSSMIEETKRKGEEAFNWGASLSDSAAALGLSVEQFQRLQKVAENTGAPIGDIAKALKEADKLIKEARSGNLEAAESIARLGLSLEDLDKLSPEQVIDALAGALATIESPADKAAAAFAVFGGEAKALLDTLQKLRGISQQGPMEGLTTEESDYLRQVERQKKGEENRARLEEARRQVTARFLERDKQGQEILGGMQSEAVRSGRLDFAGAARVITAEEAARNPAVQAEVQRILAGRVTPPPPPAPKDVATGKDLVELGKERTAKPEKVPAPKKPDKPEKEAVMGEAVTVSSLRAIGGGMAGDVAGAVDYAQVQVDLQREMVRILAEINSKSTPSTDPTKQGELDLIRPGTLGAASRIGLA